MEQWVEEIEGWDDQPFSGGYAGLHDLADRDFSGAVSTGGTWLFMVNGRVVAVVQYRQTRDGAEVVDADIERFEGASGTAYAAPDPAIPLLVAMKTREGETRGRYYSVKTPVDEVAATLEDGGFTGYVELSENVLSGDYYSVYQAGRSMDVAFIGNARRLLTDEEAHERMADEVGIYEVTAVDLDVIDVPGDGGSSAGAGAAGAAGAAGGLAATDASDAESESEPESEAGVDAPDETPAADDPLGGPVDDDIEPDSTPADGGTSTAAGPGDAASAVEATTEPAPADDAKEDSTDDTTPESPAQPSSPPSTTGTNPGSSRADPTDSTDSTDPTDPTDSTDPTDPTTGDTEGQSVPSLDPDRSMDAGNATDAAASDETDTDSSAPTSTAAPDEMADLRADLRDAKEELATARSELQTTREERDDLRATVEELRARISELESGGGSGPSLSVAEALAGTNLFVRYASKSNLTVEDAHDGAGDRDELRANLQLSHHTQFEAADATVGGTPFDDWLTSTARFRFAQWLVTTLPFEIRDTRSVDGLRELYDALPEIDRIELDGSVTVSGEDGDVPLGFDVVMRNRLGEPLVVATLEDSREPVSETSMGELVTAATDIAEGRDSLAGAFYVTSAFFSPEALETAREATSGSLLSRDRRKSYVKLSRNRGYHLGLVESREETFHLSVPDL